MPSTFRKLKLMKAGITFSEKEVLAEANRLLVSDLDFKDMNVEDAIRRVEDRLSTEQKFFNRTMLFLATITLTLFASIQGVQLEISIVGFKLDRVQAAKELILVLITAASPILTYRTGCTDELMSFRNALFERRWGANLFEAMKPTLQGEHLSGTTMENFNQRYEWGTIRRALSLSRFLLVLAGVFIFVMMIIIILAVIIIDIWNNPNINATLARGICIFSAAFLTIDLATTIAHAFGSFKFVDSEKWDQIPFFEEGTKKPTREILEAIDKIHGGK